MICHYRTLNQQLTLLTQEFPEEDNEEFHCQLDIVSDEEFTTSEDDVSYTSENR